MTEARERLEPVVFACEGESLQGLLHLPAGEPRRGVLVIVGGPQYRVGSHRQFVLLARELAAAGYAVLRFDHRGAGDSGGELRGFERIDEDIAAALAEFRRQCPALEQVYLWGLCDAASAALFHGAAHPGQVAGLMLLNPWARTAQGEASAYVSHYYGQRLLQADFWRRLLTGKVGIWRSIASFIRDLQRSRQEPAAAPSSLPARLRAAFLAYPGPVLLALSGRDLTAREFASHLDSPGWQPVAGRPGLQRLEFAAADHTFSTRRDRDALTAACRDWLDRQRA